jgi:hypothetical protein
MKTAIFSEVEFDIYAISQSTLAWFAERGDGV